MNRKRSIVLLILTVLAFSACQPSAGPGKAKQIKPQAPLADKETLPTIEPLEAPTLTPSSNPAYAVAGIKVPKEPLETKPEPKPQPKEESVTPIDNANVETR